MTNHLIWRGQTERRLPAGRQVRTFFMENRKEFGFDG
jgi:hypothetical protein